MADKPKKTAPKPQLAMSLPLDEAKKAAIMKCIKKGTLTIKISSLEALKGARATESYIYD